MEKVSLAWLALLITLNALLTLSPGSSLYIDKHELPTRKFKKGLEAPPLRTRILGVHLHTQQPAPKKWTIRSEDRTNEQRKIQNQATFSSNYRGFKTIQENFKRDQGTRSSLTGKHRVGFADRKPRPRNSLHNKEIERFKKVIRKRIKVKPRQDIEFLADNQDPGAKQDDFESPRYQEITANANSDNGDQNGFSNNYVTVIDNIDGKDTDSYNTLSSDEAKNEYTSVENSIGEGANEESELLGKEVTDVLGALTKSDSRINRVADAKLPQAQGGLPFKQTPSSYSDKGDDVDVVDEGRKDGKYNEQNGPPGDITVIEDNEDVGTNEDTRPILSKPVWDAIKQAEKNYSRQQQIVQSTVDTQSEKPNNKTRAPTYLDLPEHLPGKKNITRPAHTLSDLENTLNMFAGGTNTQSDYQNMTTKEPGRIKTKGDGKKLLLIGNAEEGPDREPIENTHPSIQSSPGHLDHVHKGNVSNANLYLNNQNRVFPSKTTSNSSFSFNSPSNTTAFETQHGNSNDLNIKPWRLDSKTSKDNQNYEEDQGDGMAVNSNSGQPGSMELERPTNEIVVGEVDPSSPDDGKDGPSTMSSLSPIASNFPIQRVPQGTTVTQDDVTIVNTTPVSLEPSGKISESNNTLPFQEGPASQYGPHAESEYTSVTQSKERLGQHNSEAQFGSFQLKQSSSMFPGEMGVTDSYLYQTDNPAAQKYNTKLRIHDNNRPTGRVNPAYINSQVNEQSKEHLKDLNYVSELGVPFQRVRARNSSLESWSEEYQSLMEKLRDLYGQAHDSTSPGQSASYRKKPAFNDTQQMMKEVSRFHSLFVDRANNQKGIVGKGMFFKDLKGNMEPGNWTSLGRMSTEYLPYIPNEGHGNDRSIYSGKSSALRFANSKEELGQIRSIQVGNLTSLRTFNLSTLLKEMPSKDDDNKPLDENKKNVSFVKQILTSRPRSSDSVQGGYTTDSLSPNRGSPSSHQVLMSYFGNETDLRKRLHSNNNDSQNELQDAGAALKSEAIQLNNNKTNTATETDRIKTTQFNLIHLAPVDANQTDTGLPKQSKNVSKDEKEESVAKYLEDFISLVRSNAASQSDAINGSIINSSEIESSSSVLKTPPEKTFASEAAKKENVTTLKDRVIIVVSPKSIRDLMRNRSGNSSQPLVHKGIPIMVGNVNSSTRKLNSSPNKTVTNDKIGQFNNSSTNQTIHDPVQRQQTHIIENDSSRKENVTSKSENDDLNEIYRDELKSLEISLSRDFMNSWIYYQRSLDEIGITPNMLRSGIANLGSPQRLKKVFRKALAGTDLNVLVVGGSISAGGGLEKDRGNVEGVYHKAFSDWWNNTVTPITTSELKINTVSIGGTDSEYFSYCIKNYMRSLPDIVIWELAANDYKRYERRDFAPAKPLEQLIRIILGLRSSPALILANFFRGNYYKTAVGQDCPDSEDEGGKSIAQYYKLTSLSWRNVICSQEDGKDLDLKKLFSSDGYHPSLLGHAQMSALLISYFKGIFEQTISQEMTLLRNRSLQREEDNILPSLAEPMFDDPVTPKPLCWTLLTPDYGQKLRNTLPDLEFTEAAGFQFANVSHWPIRRDRLRCLKAIQTGAMLKMRFIVPSSENRNGNSGSSKRELAVTTHNSFGGMGTLWIDGDQNAARIIKEQTGQRRTQVDVLTRTLTPGVHTITVYALQPGFCLSAVAVL